MSERVAIFVDGENVSAAHAAAIRKIAQRYGMVDTARVYGNALTQPKWDGQPGFRFIHTGTGKNATDILLTVQAMEAGLGKGFSTLVIASSDRDFTHLVTRLRELGISVIGVGEAKATRQFREACTQFEAVAGIACANAEPAAASKEAPKVDPLDLKIRAFIKSDSKNGRGVPVHRLGPAMHAQHGIRISTYPSKTWRAYLLGRADLYDLDPKGPDAHVRFKPAGFGSAT